jgi:BMFP domain-containing protein YqiC
MFLAPWLAMRTNGSRGLSAQAMPSIYLYTKQTISQLSTTLAAVVDERLHPLGAAGRSIARAWGVTATATTLSGAGIGKLRSQPLRSGAMAAGKVFEDISRRVNEALAASPARDIEKNAKAMMSGALAKLDVVTREEFEVQATLLLRTREKLETLEARVAALEAKTQTSSPG